MILPGQRRGNGHPAGDVIGYEKGMPAFTNPALVRPWPRCYYRKLVEHPSGLPRLVVVVVPPGLPRLREEGEDLVIGAATGHLLADLLGR